MNQTIPMIDPLEIKQQIKIIKAIEYLVNNELTEDGKAPNPAKVGMYVKLILESKVVLR